MSRQAILLVLAACAALSVAITEEEMHAIIHGLATQCEEVYPITEEDAELLHKHEAPKSPNGVCFLTCMFEKLGIMENGAFNAAHAKAIVQKYTAEQPDIQSKMGELLDICEGEVGSGDEKCGAGMEVFTCFKNHAERLGFMPDA
ncbi:uncharacterized protein LOC134534111 [Bacillus rossius redtenbacheri]|uniref:uncharacterized protein LOC134534111 n=1 Tax=Bacillus rossius redtenbacheri TaxID=93214 RepID=UPI002FDE9A3E